MTSSAREFAEILERDLKSGYGPSRAELILLIESRDADLTRLAQAQGIQEAAARAKERVSLYYSVPSLISDVREASAMEQHLLALLTQPDKDALAAERASWIATGVSRGTEILEQRVQQAVREEAELWEQEHYTESNDAIQWACRRLAELCTAAGAPEEKKL